MSEEECKYQFSGFEKSQDDEMKVNLLKKAIDEEIEFCDAEIAKKKEEIEAYKRLRKNVGDLPKKLTYNVNVPISKVGFIPGRLVHTNKVMVLLGDNYFAECSCFHACSIIERRILFIQRTVCEFEEQRNRALYQTKLSKELFDSGNGQVEIREPFNEKEYKKKKKIRVEETGDLKTGDLKKSTPEEAKSVEKSAENTVDDEISAKYSNLTLTLDDEDLGDNKNDSSAIDESYQKLLERLDELEIQEEEAGELETDDSASIDSDDFHPVCNKTPLPPNAEKSLLKQMWEDENETSKKICPQPIIVETDNQSKKKRRTVRFKTEDETYSAKPIPDLSLDLEIVNEEPRFSCSMPRSILRNYEEKSPVDVEALAATVECEREQKVIPVSTTTFTGTVVERDPSSDNNPSTESQSIKTSPKNGSSRRVSKFKMSRAQFD